MRTSCVPGAAYQSECLGLRGNRLGNQPFGNQSKTAVSLETPWKHPAQKYSFAVTSVVTAPRQMRCFMFTRCLPWAKNARFHGYRRGYQCLGYRPSNRLISGHTAQDQQSVGCQHQKKTRRRAGAGGGGALPTRSAAPASNPQRGAHGQRPRFKHDLAQGVRLKRYPVSATRENSRCQHCQRNLHRLWGFQWRRGRGRLGIVLSAQR